MPEFVAISAVQIPNRLEDLFKSRLIAPTIRDGPELDKLFVQDTGELVQQLPGQPVSSSKESRDLLNSQKLANAEYTAFQRQAIMRDIQFNLVLFVQQVTKTALDIFPKNTQDLSKKTSQHIPDQSGTTKQFSLKNAITRINQQNENKNSFTSKSVFREKVGDKGSRIDLVDQQSVKVSENIKSSGIEYPLEKKVSAGIGNLVKNVSNQAKTNNIFFILSPVNKSIDISI